MVFAPALGFDAASLPGGFERKRDGQVVTPGVRERVAGNARG
jgi:hypothetical protein